LPFLFGDFDEEIIRVKSRMLVEAIKNSPGGYKLSMEMITILAIHFEDCFLPGEAQATEEAIRYVTGVKKRKSDA
jgi:hypothetical protein